MPVCSFANEGHTEKNLLTEMQMSTAVDAWAGQLIAGRLCEAYEGIRTARKGFPQSVFQLLLLGHKLGQSLQLKPQPSPVDRVHLELGKDLV